MKYSPFFCNSKKRLYCFTPEVMLGTFLIEIILSAYVFIRYKMTAFSRVAGITLVFLAIFQAAEYKICTGDYTLLWARIGIAIITFLPILGVHLLAIINGNARWLRFVYPIAALFTFYLIFSNAAVIGASCGGNYVLFDSAVSFYWMYSFYYIGTLFFSLIFSYNQILKIKRQKNKIRLLNWFNAGYLSFLLPMVIVYAFFTKNGVPSIMCGFAIVFALILALRVVPLYYNK